MTTPTTEPEDQNNKEAMEIILEYLKPGPTNARKIVEGGPKKPGERGDDDIDPPIIVGRG